MRLLTFLLKIAVPALLVAAMSLAARRWGATVAGLIMGLPWMTGPVLFFLGLDKGTDFAIAATVGIELGAVSIAGYVIAYAAAAQVAPWPVALASGIAGFATTAAIVRGLDVTLSAATVLGIVTLLACASLLPKPRGEIRPLSPPWWDIPVRMLVTLALVAGILLSADHTGPTLSGIISTYPVILTVVGTFTHAQIGRDGVMRILRGISISLVGFCLFFFTVGTATPALGLVLAFAIAAVVSVSYSGLLIVWSRRPPRTAA